jgi:hypothetical protein
VISSPHSGSTLLGIVLSGHPEVVFGGELFEIPEPGWNPTRPCSCGKLVGECPFWTRVRTEYHPTSLEHQGSDRSAPRWGWRAFPRMLLAGHQPRPDIQHYATDVAGLAKAISEVSGRRIVIDTSKDGTRALAYTLGPPGATDVRFIHLLREGGGVVSSRRNREIRTSSSARASSGAVLRYSILWAGANIVFGIVFSIRKQRYLRVRYEDFLSDPEATLRTIGEFLEIDLTTVIERVRRDDAFAPGHILSGNRLRLGGGTQVRRAAATGTDPLTRRERQLFSWVGGWAAWLFGYD